MQTQISDLVSFSKKKQVYYSSLAAGPEHIRTAAGYYQMSEVLLKQGKSENALAMYDAIAEIWKSFLEKIHTKQMNLFQELGLWCIRRLLSIKHFFVCN